MPTEKEQPKMTSRQKKELEARKKFQKSLLISAGALAVFIIVVALIYFLPRMSSSNKKTDTGIPANANSDYAKKTDPVATITMEDGGVIEVQLYPAAAPNTVANFIELANSGYYDGLTFHRIVSGFMIQGGDPEGTGYGGPGYTIKGEFTDNGYTNNMTHSRGVISMGRKGGDMDSAGSQFFIMLENTPSLDGQYAAFGEVISGMDEVDKIGAAEVSGETPVNPVVIKSITVETNGVEYVAEKID